MSVSQSFLSSPRYGYAIAVATTQQSINATMKAYLSTLSQPLVEICYVADKAGNPTPIPYQELLQRAHGSDPFKVPAGADPNTNQDLINLKTARFMVGFKARIGLPPGLKPLEVPDVVTFGLSTTNVTFSLMCSEFLVVSLNPGGGYDPASWLSESQPSGKPWIFQSQVNLQQLTVGSDKYNTLPPAVREAISGYHAGTFGVQQLLFDLDNAALETVPKIVGVNPGSNLYTVLLRDFIGVYFDQCQKDGQPVLGCTVTRIGPDRSTLKVTNVQMQVGPYVDGNGQIIQNPTRELQNLATLNYLCTVENETPPPPVPFSWNWLGAGEGVDGVVALNRNKFARYVRDQVYEAASRCCFKPRVRVWVDGLDVWYQWGLTGHQSPTVEFPADGETVLKMSYNESAQDEAGLNGALGEMKLNPMYTLEARFVGNTIVVTQNLKIYLYARVLATGDGGNVVNIKITNTYTLYVDATGNLKAKMESTREDHSESPGVNGFLNFFTDLNKLIENVKQWTQSLAVVTFSDLPLMTAHAFVFPGGNTFAYKDVVFSEHQDLVSRVTYADPTRLHLSKLARTEAPLARARLAEDAEEAEAAL